MFWRSVDVEKLVAEDHAARAIWEFVGRLDLSGYYQAIESSPEVGGRPAFDPQLLISLWEYAYSLGIGSAREIARRCEWEPGFRHLSRKLCSWLRCSHSLDRKFSFLGESLPEKSFDSNPRRRVCGVSFHRPRFLSWLSVFSFYGRVSVFTEKFRVRIV